MLCMLAHSNTLPNEPSQLKSLLHSAYLKTQKISQEIDRQKQEILCWQEKYYRMLEQFKLLQQHRFAASTEKNPDQACLFNEAEAPIEEECESATVTIAEHERKKHPKRTALPEHLPREIIEYDISLAEKQCDCGCQKERFGEEITEQLDIIPAQLKVIRHVRPKYACKACEGNISIASMPNLLLPKSIAAPGLVADAITSKYVDHIPLYRQEMIWQRYGVTIPRNTSCGWLMKIAEICEPLLPLLQSDILASGYVQADETPLQVLNEPERRDQQKSYMWVYRGNTQEHAVVLYDYQETREAKHPQSFLSGYQGYLQTDGYLGYNWVDDTKGIIHLGCMAQSGIPADCSTGTPHNPACGFPAPGCSTFVSQLGH